MIKILACIALAPFISFLASANGNAAEGPSMPQLGPWVDPSEHAFTVKVPVGWRITGGTHRNAPIDVRNFVRAESPDGTVKVWIDDPNILPRQAPHPAYYRLGWNEGRVVAGPLARY
jgi:hypothetical protein